MPDNASLADFEEDDNAPYIEETTIVADAKQTLIRLDKFLVDRLRHFSRNRIQQAIADGLITINDRKVSANYKIRPADVVKVQVIKPAAPLELVAQNIPLDIVHEDDHLVVVHKPPGLVVHPGHGNWDGTLVNGLLYHFGKLPSGHGGEIKPGLVHRIDKDTSGLLLVAKTPEAFTHLAKQFHDHTIERSYLALVWGEPDNDTGTISGHIGRSPSDRRMYTVYPEGEVGKHAVTHYEVLERLRYISLLRCKLETGRTHQIRVHMKHIGHTLFNDKMYGGDKILKGERFSKYKQFIDNCFNTLPRQGLHAQTLGFVHPASGENVTFTSNIPADMEGVLSRFKRYVQEA